MRSAKPGNHLKKKILAASNMVAIISPCPNGQMLVSFSLVEILRTVTKFRQIEKAENLCLMPFIKHEIISHGSHAVMATKE